MAKKRSVIAYAACSSKKMSSGYNSVAISTISFSASGARERMGISFSHVDARRGWKTAKFVGWKIKKVKITVLLSSTKDGERG